MSLCFFSISWAYLFYGLDITCNILFVLFYQLAGWFNTCNNLFVFFLKTHISVVCLVQHWSRTWSGEHCSTRLWSITFASSISLVHHVGKDKNYFWNCKEFPWKSFTRTGGGVGAWTERRPSEDGALPDCGRFATGHCPAQECLHRAQICQTAQRKSSRKIMKSSFILHFFRLKDCITMV